MEKPIKWLSDFRFVRDLIPADYNPRKIDESSLENLKTSLKKFDVADPVIINTNNRIIGGHQRIKAMIAMGKQNEVIDVRVPSRELTLEEEKELNLRLNKNTGEFDFDLLSVFGENMLKDVGFNSAELDRIFKGKTNEDDAAPDLPKEPKAKRGDIYQLGQHRIMCGDSTLSADVDILMKITNKADLIFTDPPYNINYSGRGEETSNTIENDNMTSEAFTTFLNAIFKNYATLINPDAPMYVCYAFRTHIEFENAVKQANFEIKNQIIWVKLVATMGWGDYRWKHEPMLYCKPKGAKSEFFGDRKQYIVWEQEKSDEELLAMFKKMIAKDESGESTVWKFNRDSQYKHPTQKPIDLISKAIINSSKRGDLVVDLFLGSGSTLIACEKTNRICYGMELDPRYIDVIIERWEEWSGGKAIKL